MRAVLVSWHSTTELRPQPYFLPLSRVTLRRQVPLRPVTCHVSPVAARYLPANFQITSSFGTPVALYGPLLDPRPQLPAANVIYHLKCRQRLSLQNQPG